jgi:hypothetical protein
LTLVGDITGTGVGSSSCIAGGEFFPPFPPTLFSAPGIPIASRTGVHEINVQLYREGVFKEGNPEPEPEVIRWTRVFLHDSLTWPTPGEFLGLAYRPMPYLPWFSQDTSPVLYSGNWWETLFYSSGVVQSIIEEGGAGGIGDVGATYTILVKGETVQAKSSDFAVYAVGDRVALMKQYDSSAKSMTWKDLGAFDSWIILPVTFYGAT